MANVLIDRRGYHPITSSGGKLWLDDTPVASIGLSIEDPLRVSEELSGLNAEGWHDVIGSLGMARSSLADSIRRQPSANRGVREGYYRARARTNQDKSLRQRVANANNYFSRKASEVFNDEASLRLLAHMYRNGIIELAEFDSCQYGIPMAKLAAANFCEIGASVIHITQAGQEFIESIEKA